MSEANKRLMRRWFEEVWNRRRESAIDEMLHTNGKSHGLPDPDSFIDGPEGFKAVQRAFIGAFPDMHIEIEDMVAEGDLVATRWSVTMTHLGDHLGLAATGRAVRLKGSSFDLIRDGKIVEGWNQMDMGALMQALREPAA